MTTPAGLGSTVTGVGCQTPPGVKKTSMLNVSAVHVLSEPQGAPRRRQGSLVQVLAPERYERLPVQRRPSAGSQCSGGRHLHRQRVRGAGWSGAQHPQGGTRALVQQSCPHWGSESEQESRAAPAPRRTRRGAGCHGKAAGAGVGSGGAVLGVWWQQTQEIWHL